jgi:PAS domain-containing protein
MNSVSASKPDNNFLELASFFQSRQRQLPTASWIQMMALLDRLSEMATHALENKLFSAAGFFNKTRSALILDCCDVGENINENFQPINSGSTNFLLQKNSSATYIDILYELNLPFYITDPDGTLQMYSPAAENFWGWSPTLGKQRWCGSWKLETEDGKPLKLEECPMAQCVQTQTAIRGRTAVALRPDGKRKVFTALPTPVLRDDSLMVAAINVLIERPGPTI